ncbi:MAG: flagellar biosynthetic protein FliO [Gammaproteobacteria bacterium]|nr:flagellar biosynthetic protein FliO [Gammaproteobacteria bacterium]
MAGNLAQTTLGLLVVLLVIGAAAWAFKRFGNVHVGAQGRMKIIGGISLGTRERAVLLQVGEQQLVIGVSPGRVQTLHVLDKPVLVEDKPENSTNFSSRLQAAILNRKGDISEGKK